jgi:ELWxxDGT repeat protein
MPPAPYSSEGGFLPIPGGAVFNFHWDDDFRFMTSELWRSDGTATGTFEVVDFGAPRAASRPRSIGPRASGIVFGAVPDGFISTTHAFRSDGTEVGTYEMTPELPNPDEIVELADGEALVALRHADPGLWRTDGDLLTALPAGIHNGPDLTRVGHEVYFAGWDAGAGRELWKTDGTPAGTSRVADLFPGAEASDPHDLTAALDRLWFGLGSWWSATGSIWESAGTAATTIEHPFDFPIYFDSEPTSIRELDPIAGTLTFKAGGAVWRLAASDGTVDLIRQLQTVPYEAFPSAVLGGALYFVDAEQSSPCGLFRSLGTAAQTTLVRSVGCRSDRWAASIPEEMVVFGNRVYFQGCNSETGCELWASDGSAAGTGPLADLAPGGASSMPVALRPVEDRLYFRACTPAAGCEPWVTDGSRAGTHRLGDIWPGPGSSLNSTETRFTRSGRLVYFAADDGTGEELWAMPLEIFYDGFETGSTSRW